MTVDSIHRLSDKVAERGGDRVLDKDAWLVYSSRRAAVIDSIPSEEKEELERALDDLYVEMVRVKDLLGEARQPPS